MKDFVAALRTNENGARTKTLIAAGITVAAVAAGITHQLNKRRLKKPLPGTTKIEKIYIIKTPVKK